MVQLRPETLKTDNFGETLVFEALQQVKNKDNWIALHSLKQSAAFTTAETETDFLVFVPGHGIVIIESKGATSVIVQGDEWQLEGVAASKRKKNPFAQIDNAKRTIRGFLKQRGYDLDAIPISRLVWFPRISAGGFTQGTGTSFEIDELAFSGELKDASAYILANLKAHIARYKGHATVHYEPKTLSPELAAELAETLRPNLRAKMSPAERASERRIAVNKATEEQMLVLELIAQNNHVYFDGPAGSGKTHLLVRSAYEMKKQGRRVLYVCFNEMLAEDIAKQFANVPGITVLNLNQALLQIAGLTKNKREDSAWFNVDLPALAAKAVSKHRNIEFEAICIDEFQDIADKPAAFLALLGTLSNRHRPFRVMMAGDDHQQIYASGAAVDSFKAAKEELPKLVHISLNTNCRQAPELSRAISDLMHLPRFHTRHRIAEDMKGKLEIFETTKATEARDLARVIKKLLEDYEPSQIRVLSVFGGKQSTSARLFQETETHSAELRELKKLLKDPTSKNGKIAWRSIAKYKGLEDEVVIITDISEASREYLNNRQSGQRFEDQVYVGLTRARTHAIMLVQDGLYAKQAKKLK